MTYAGVQQALADPDHLYTRDQAVWLMGLAQRWAQEHAADAVQAAYDEGYRRGLADSFEAGRFDAIFCDVQALIQRAYLPEPRPRTAVTAVRAQPLERAA